MSEASKEAINEGLFRANREVKSNETKDLNVDITDAKEIIKARTKEIVYNYNRDNSVKKKIRKDIDSAMKIFDPDEFDGFDSNRNVPKLICYVYEETPTSMILAIYDGSQAMRVALSSTIKNIKKELMKDKMIKSLPGLNDISTGDGDEGCIYVDFKK